MPPPRPAERASRAGGGGRKHKVAVDTNIISLSLGHLAEPAAPATGDPVFCGGCAAALNSLSTVRDARGRAIFGPEAEAAAAGGKEEEEAGEGDDGTQRWVCEFCGHDNEVELDEEEFPTAASCEYLLESAVAGGAARGAAGGDAAAPAVDDSLVVFVVDVSGSMCVTSEVEGKVAFKGDRSGSMRSLLGRGDDAAQLMPGQRRDVTYVSRLQAVQAAITTQLASLKADHPTRRAALVSFNNEVCVVGDGTAEPRTLAGDRLDNEANMLAAGAEAPLPGPVAETADGLAKKIFALEEGGATALGPAMASAVGLASRKAGSRIVLCTDGLANVGLGALEVTAADEAAAAAGALDDDGEAMTAQDVARARARTFYESLGRAAAAAGVVVDVIGIEGDGCDLEMLGTTLAEATGGSTEKVNPMELRKNFASSLVNPIIAFKVTATLLLHWGLAFRGDDAAAGAVGAGGGAGGDAGAPAAGSSSSSSSKLVREIGNVTADTAITFEYGQRRAAELGERAAAMRDVTSLPFQLQVRYTKPDGAAYVRVLSQAKPVTRERATAEARMDMRVCGTHVAQSSASMARAGEYKKARVRNFAFEKMMRRNVASEEQAAGYSAWVGTTAAMDDAVTSEMHREAAEGLSLDHSDDEDDAGDADGGGFFDRIGSALGLGSGGARAGAPAASAPSAASSSMAFGGAAGGMPSASRSRSMMGKKKKASSKARASRRHGNDGLSVVLQKATHTSFV